MLHFKRFLKRFLISLLIAFTFWFVDTYIVKAETFTDSDRFSYYVYNNNTLLKSGRGLFTYQTNQATRTEFLYQAYTFYNQYYYDITLDISIDSGNWYQNATGCNIGIPGNATFTPYFSKDYSGGVGHLKCSVYNFTANQLNNLFINFYNNQGQYILYNIVKYELSINAKQNTSPTSESINQGFNSVINNQNNNTQTIIDNQNNNTQTIIDNINDDDTSGATSDAHSFFNDFTTDTHGLTSIITAPLTSIASLTSSTCSPLVLPLPFVDKPLTLPCMREIYDEHFGAFMTIYDIVVIGIISYWIIVRIFTLVKDFKNPEHDEIEVMEL